jgi:hypothetical protein
MSRAGGAKIASLIQPTYEEAIRSTECGQYGTEHWPPAEACRLYKVKTLAGITFLRTWAPRRGSHFAHSLAVRLLPRKQTTRQMCKRSLCGQLLPFELIPKIGRSYSSYCAASR